LKTRRQRWRHKLENEKKSMAEEEEQIKNKNNKSAIKWIEWEVGKERAGDSG